MAGEKAIRAWCLYDVGQSAFSTTVMAAVLPIYFSSVAGADLDPDPERARVLASSHWGYTNTIALALCAVAAPLLGALGDRLGRRKQLLAGFAVMGAMATALLFFVQRGDWLLAAGLYVLGRLAFSSSIVMYDSLLPFVARPDQVDSVSSRGFAWGYLGGGVLLALQLVAIMAPERLGLADAGVATRLAFLSVALWWLAFTVPLLRDVDEGLPQRAAGAAGDAFRRLVRTFKEVRQHREAFKFLAAFWLYNDGIGTIIVMGAVFGAEIGLSQTTLIGAILALQFLGFPFSLAFGWLARRFGAKPSILIALVGYMGICVLGYFMDSARDFWMLAIGVSMFQGGAQALSRSLYASMIPPGRSSEFFGFYDVSSKFAGLIGPLVFATVGAQLGSSRYGVLALIFFFVAGAALLWTVNPRPTARTVP